jgi:hypothetical protein
MGWSARRKAHEVMREQVLLDKCLSPQIREITYREIDVAVFHWLVPSRSAAPLTLPWS